MDQIQERRGQSRWDARTSHIIWLFFVCPRVCVFESQKINAFHAESLDVYFLGSPILRLDQIFRGGASIQVGYPNLVAITRVSNFSVLVFNKTNAGIYGIVSIFPSEGGYCVSDAQALKVL